MLPKKLKIALLLPLLKKVNADFEQFSNFCPMSNLKFLSKLIEKAVFVHVEPKSLQVLPLNASMITSAHFG